MCKEILIADEDRRFVENLKYTLNENAYKIDAIYSSGKLLKKIQDKKYDLIILDNKIGNIDGMEACKAIRNKSTVPIIVTSNSDEIIAKILALENGADDYLVKPLNISELQARMKTIFRRMEYKANKAPKHICKINNFNINFLKKIISIKNKDINFTSKEFDLFYILSSNPDKVFTREELLDEVWGYEHYGDVRTVDVHVRRIREKIERNTGHTEYIMTKWGEGYYFNSVESVS